MADFDTSYQNFLRNQNDTQAPIAPLPAPHGNPGGWTNSNWSYLLPIALGVASAFSPNLGRAAGAIFHGLDWITQQRKENRRLSSLQNVGNVITQAQAQGKYPNPAELVAPSGGNLDAVLPWANLFASLSRETPLTTPGGGIGSVAQTPSGMRLTQLMPGESEISRATQMLIQGGIPNPTAEQIQQKVNLNRLILQSQQQQLHTVGQVNQQQALMPGVLQQAQGLNNIQVGGQVSAARQIAPIHTEQQINTATGMLPIQERHAQDVSKINEEALKKPTPALATLIDKQIAALEGKYFLPQTQQEQAETDAQLIQMRNFRTHVMNKIAETYGIPKPEIPTTPTGNLPAAPAKPGQKPQFPNPTAGDLADYRVKRRQALANGNQAAVDALDSRAKQTWGYVPQ
jgi:hypothetical protein